MFNPFKNEKNDLTNLIILDTEEELNNYPLQEKNTLIVLNDMIKDQPTFYCDIRKERQCLGRLVYPEVLDRIKHDLSFIEGFVEESKRSKIIDIKETSGKIVLEENKDYTMTIYGDTSFRLPFNPTNKESEIHVEIAFNPSGSLNIGTKWKTSSVPISFMGIYFITYRYSEFLNNWVATIELVSD